MSILDELESTFEGTRRALRILSRADDLLDELVPENDAEPDADSAEEPPHPRPGAESPRRKAQ